MENKHYKELDLIRVISCISILLYHIGILKGGYLAVCTFFVLTGYLSVISFFKKDDFSIKEYYENKIKRIYFPVYIVVLMTVTLISLMKNINYYNLKPEVTSILLGYNNYWQLNANLDYFVRHVSSPFMHLWFISIILQIELILPFILITLKKIGKKTSKIIPCLILIIISIISYIMFYITIKNGNLMSAYYKTSTRIFSITLGLLIGFIHTYHKPIIINNKIIINILFKLYLLIITILFITIDFKSNLFFLSMILTTLISMRLIDYGIMTDKNKKNSIISFISKISYEIYLVQYPVIYFFQNIKIDNLIKIPLIIAITIFVSLIIKLALSEKNKNKIIRVLLLIIIIPISMYGFYRYAIAKDYTDEIKKLESDLNKNREIIKERQEQYEQNIKKEKDEWQNTLNDLNNTEEELKERIKNMHIVGIGDSIMELAIKDLYKEFPNGYFDAKVNRTTYQVNDILKNLINRNILGDVVVFNIGTNGDLYKKHTDEIMKTLGNRKVFWINTTHADYPDFNEKLIKFANNYENIYIIDWESVAKQHPEYIISDGVHPTVRGCKEYAKTIYDEIYEEYLKEFRIQKEEKIKEYEETKKKKITFIGNDLLLGIYKYIQNDYPDSSFIIDENLDYNILKAKLDEKNLNYKLVFVFDKNVNITEEEYQKLFELYDENEFYIVTLSNNLIINDEKVKIIDFSSELNNNTHDGIHLTEEGNIKLQEKIKNILNNTEQ